MVLAPCLLLAEEPLPSQAASEKKTEPAGETKDGLAEGPGERDRRAQLNLLGQTDTNAGESRRNENVQFNLIDNNALKELNLRLGTTATLADEFGADRKYFGSEFGNAPGAPIHLAAPPARPAQPHGQLFYSHLNSALTARSFFQVGEVQPAREHDYGFSVTAPLREGTDLTLNGGQTRIRGQVNGNVLVPLPEERIPLSTDPDVTEVVLRMLSAYPDRLPNRQDIAPRMLNTNSPQEIDNNILGGRVDQRLSELDRLFLRYEFLSQQVRAFQFVKGQNPDTRTRSHLARATWTRAWSPGTVSDLSLGFQRVGSQLTPEDDYIGMQVTVGGVIETSGPGNAIPVDRAQNDYEWAGKLSMTRGRHQAFAGFGGIRRQVNGIESDAHLQYFSFSNNYGADALTNLRLGRPSRYFLGTGSIHRGFRLSYLSAYAGDKWGINSRLAVTLGLRWEGQSKPVEVNRLNEFPYGGDFNNAGPTAAVALRLSDRWGVVRAAYGLHYGEVFAVTAQQIRFNAPLNYKLVIQDPDLLDPLAGIGDTPPTDTRSVWYDFAPDLATPYSHLYNFTWELAPLDAVRLQAGYVGSRSVKLLHHWYLNRAHPVPGVPLETGTIDQRRADQRYTDIRRVVNGSRGYFDAAKLTAITRWKGWSGELAYWFSKAIDLGAGYTDTAQDNDSFRGGSQHEYDVHRDLKGLSRFDQPHSFLARGGYDLPHRRASGWTGLVFGDWSVSGVVLLKSGTPFSVSSGSDAPGFGNVDGGTGDRPHVIDPGVLGRTIGHPDRSRELLPREAFAFIGIGERSGNLGRHTFRRGPIRNVNFALSKSWRLRQEREITLRAESINFLNTPQFAEPDSHLTNPSFGLITNTLNDGRVFRFLLRIGF
jgi:hypothetical protein